MIGAESGAGRLDEERSADRTKERGTVLAEVASRLRSRGVTVYEGEDAEDVADLLSAVEEFEREVQQRGGDLMVDEVPSLEPDRPEFLLPLRRADEAIRDYIGRLQVAAGEIREHGQR